MIYEKRGRWCWRGKDGNLRKFPTEAAAKAALALDAPVNPWMLFMAEGALIVLLLQWFF